MPDDPSPGTYQPGAWLKSRATAGVLRQRDPNADITPVLRQMHIEHLADKIAATVAEAPPLTETQRQILRDALNVNQAPLHGGQMPEPRLHYRDDRTTLFEAKRPR